MMIGQKFPVQERVAAGVSYTDMLREFGWAGCLIVSIFMAYAVDEIVRVFGCTSTFHGGMVVIASRPRPLFAWRIRSFGRPMFVFLLLVMILLATTEIGTDSWIAALMTPVLKDFGEQRRQLRPHLHVGDHVRAALLRRTDRAPHLAARPARRSAR